MAEQTQLVEWFRRWHKPIRGYLRKRAELKDVDDLASEVWLRIMRYDETAIENPQGYLFKVAANVAFEWRERHANLKPHESTLVEELMAESLETCDEKFWSDAKCEAVRYEIGRLPQRQRDVLLLHVNDGLTYKQIAAREGLTYRTVLRDLVRAYATLRTNLRELQ